MFDVANGDGYAKSNAALEVNVIIQNLITAWPRKYDSLHDFDHTKPVKDVLPIGTDLAKIHVRRSNSLWAKIVRGEGNELENLDEYEKEFWSGVRSFTEKTIETSGLRMRNDATSTE